MLVLLLLLVVVLVLVLVWMLVLVLDLLFVLIHNAAAGTSQDPLQAPRSWFGPAGAIATRAMMMKMTLQWNAGRRFPKTKALTANHPTRLFGPPGA